MGKLYDNKPLVSVIIPIYNAATTLERCLSFIVNQVYKNFEVICVDDCSTDSTAAIIHKYQLRHSQNIVYIREEKHQGPGGARNHGLAAAQGDYISFLDSDDWIDSNLLSTVIPKMHQENADIAIFGVKDEFEHMSNCRIRYSYDYNIIDHTFALRLLTRTYNNNSFISPMVCQKIYKRSFLKQNYIRFDANSYFEDDFFTFQCFLHESKIILVPNVYYHYYQRTDSITHTFSKKHINDLISMINDLKNYLVTNNLWICFKKDYFCYCDKCIRSTLNILFTAEPQVAIQKKYLAYLFSQLQLVISIEEWIKYTDILTIKRIFQINI